MLLYLPWSSPSSKWKFLWQIPVFQTIQYFILWNKLRQNLQKRDILENFASICEIKNTKLDQNQKWMASDVEQNLKKHVNSNQISFLMNLWRSKHEKVYSIEWITQGIFNNIICKVAQFLNILKAKIFSFTKSQFTFAYKQIFSLSNDRKIWKWNKCFSFEKGR